MSDPSPTVGTVAPALLELREALLEGADTERVRLAAMAGRVLASPAVADRAVPRHSTATMDGFAVDAAEDPDGLAVREGRLEPGDDPTDHDPGTASRVTTGGPLPEGADAVVPVEAATVTDDGLAVEEPPATGQHVLERGSVLADGQTVLEAGRRLAPRDAAILRELDRATVRVRERLSAAVLATGTEIHAGREPDRDSEMLANLLESWGLSTTLAGSVPDDARRVGERVEDLAADHAIVVTTGGTGASAIDETGPGVGDRSTVRVSDVAVRPGSNTTVAWLDAPETAVVALPGPPGAAFASAAVLARPLFVGEGATPAVAGRAAVELDLPDRPVEFVVPVEFATEPADPSPDGGTRRSVVALGHPASSVHLYDRRYRPHRVSSCPHLSAADGFVLRTEGFEAGDRLEVVPYPVVES